MKCSTTITPFYSYNALKNIKVQRRLTSDLLDISYTSGDPGIAYNTVSILMDEFVEDEYRRIRYGETDKVIKYFEEELKRIGKKTQLGGRRPDQVQRRKTYHQLSGRNQRNRGHQ